MKRLIVSAGLFLAGANLAQAADLIVYNPPVIDETIYADVLPSEFYFSIEALALWRSNSSTVLLDDSALPPGEILVSDRDIAGLGMGWGARFQLGGPISDQFGWQVGGFLAGNFASSGSYLTPAETTAAVYDNDVTPGNLHFEASDVSEGARFSESSSIGGVEVSGTYDMGGFRVFAGPRYLRYQSALNTSFYEEQGDFETDSGDVDRVGITSTNHLFGGQIGIEGMAPVTDVISFGGRAAVGLYANHAVLDRTFSNDNGGGPFGADGSSASSSANGFAASVEISPKLALAVTENVDVTLGGTLLFVHGVDEPGTHYQGIGAPGGGGELAANSPSFGNNVHFGGLTFGLQGTF